MPVALVIARTTFIEAVRQPVYFLIILFSALLQAFNTSATGYSLGYTESAEVFGDNKLLLELGLATVLFCGSLLAGFIATAAVSQEIENRTVLTIVSKPVPRWAVILGKYLGAAAALTLAGTAMIAFLLLGIRHGVMTTTADQINAPVIVFGLGALLISTGVAVWGNFFYGWPFTQTAALLLVPLAVLAWLLTLFISKDWGLETLSKSFKPQVALASLVLILALLVLAAVAVAASTRLGQVMTVTVCFGAFVLGLLSNFLVGRFAFTTQLVAPIAQAEPERDRFEPFAGSGDTYFITLRNDPTTGLKPGDVFRFGPNPNGFDPPHEPFGPFAGTLGDTDTYFRPDTPPALLVTAVEGRRLTVRNIGSRPVRVSRPPRPGDWVYASPTRVNPLAVAVWGVVPNVQFFWLADAVTQNRPVPLSHVLRLGGYAGAQVAAFLAAAVLLFQRREVG